MRAPLRPQDLPLVDQLATRTPSELLPALLEVLSRQATRRPPSELVEQFQRDGFVRPSAVDLRVTLALDRIALDVAAAFEAVLLSPLAPLGVCSVVSPTHQDRAVSTIRGSEVVSDPTNVLALECARRLAADRSAHVRLCTIHQVVRPQRFAPRPGFSQHFRMFALAEAGLAQPEHGFEVTAVVDHVALFCRLMAAFEPLGCRFANPRATLLTSPARRACSHRIRQRLRESLPELPVVEAELGSSYYDGVRVFVEVDDLAGSSVPLCDTGLFDWVGRLTSNRRMRLVASGFGLQLVPLTFHSGVPAP
jgi:hypothetical protein